MSIVQSELRRAPWVSDRAALALFSFTLFLSAFLLFSVQPFFAKMVLPRLGGSPAVWSIAMVFFQAVLLAGYGYAHVLTSRLPLKSAIVVHLAVMAVAFLALPIAIPASWDNPPETGQALWLLGLFAVSVGLPFFAVSANGPLLQAWFARSGHPHAADPYFLYGASNIGSFASLFLYILAFEPLTSVPVQGTLWTVGFVMLAASIALSGATAMRNGAIGENSIDVPGLADAGPAPSFRDKAAWIGLAAIPSGLLVAVTAQVSTDLAAAPFLWVIPLALFLLTFVLVFRQKPLIAASWMETLLPFAAVGAVISLAVGVEFPAWLGVGAHYGFFFIAAMAAHGLLASKRPAAAHLTSFYFLMSVGGVIGGVFASLIAPQLFNSIAEYPILIAAALLALGPVWQSGAKQVGVTVAVALAIGATAPFFARHLFPADTLTAQLAINGAALAIAMLVLIRRRPLLGFGLFAVAVMLVTEIASINPPVAVRRSFFGVTTVVEGVEGQYRRMMHGTTMHGAMRFADETGKALAGKPEPLTYYHSASGMADAIAETRKRLGGKLGRAGIVGLGAGSLACYRQDGETWDFFEIDRDVVDLAADSALFRFMPECAGDSRIVIGDARLKLAAEADGAYDILVIDAFSSDSIPVHLMTVEALALYRAKLKANGMIVMHISNRHMELGSVLAANGAALGMKVLVGGFPGVTSTGGPDVFKSASRVAFLANDEADFAALAASPHLERQGFAAVRPWTDDYSNVLGAIWRTYFGG